MADIFHETAPSKDLRLGNVTVGLSAVRLAEPGPQPAYKGVMVVCPTTNTRPVWISSNPNVQANSSAMGGFPVDPGRGVVLPVDNPACIWAISSDTDQLISWMAV